ncbi:MULTISPECIES: disulfide bond formation protein B [Pseudophaeobacter]|jgi:disulfide bond formation protein DsbB|uniref:disulfide bond formation protein B n=1 Tax=Pseudophaeobacter TaxID=1541822 RepID=UPI002430F5F7|nr:disulfide bond formation protein B [Pseudophaeobacter profundi]
MRRLFLLAATVGSALMMLGALGFQYIGEMAPCKLCYWQRYPHLAAIGIGVLALILPMNALLYLGAAAALTTAGIGIYHTGVERGLWQGPTTCTSGPIDGLTPEQLMQQILGAPLVRCDDIPWDLFGLSMASWNAIASIGLACLWVAAARSKS